jgi:hypothetical protein
MLDWQLGSRNQSSSGVSRPHIQGDADLFGTDCFSDVDIKEMESNLAVAASWIHHAKLILDQHACLSLSR